MKRAKLQLLRLGLSIILLNLLCVSSNAQLVTIPTGNTQGTGASTTIARKPYGAFFGYERTALIYLASEIGISSGGSVTSIAFYLDAVSSPVAVPVNIYMKNTSNSTFAATTTVATEESGATLVYTGTVSATTAGGWVTTTLTTPFAYVGSSNLEIIIEENYGGGGGEGSAAKTFRYTNQGTGVNRLQYWQTDTNPPTGTGTLSNYRMNLQLNIIPPACSGTPNNGSATTTTPSFNCSGAPVLNATGLSFASNITYQWEVSATGANSWSNVGGVLTSPAFTAPVISASMDYRVKSTCASSGITSTSALTTVTVTSALNAGTATTVNPTITCNGGPSLNATGVTTGNGITYQWQSSPAGQNTWSSVGSAQTTPSFLAPSISSSTDYRVVSSCAVNSTTNTSSSVPVTVQSVTVNPVSQTICASNSATLNVVSPAASNPTLYSEDFNNGLPSNMTFVNTTTGANAALAAWLIRADGYVDGLQTLHSPTNTSFILTNSDDAGNGATVHTEMISPILNTNGYSTLSLTFKHYFRWIDGSIARVQVTTDGTNWTTLPGGQYSTATVGGPSAFATATFDLSAYLNQANFQVRWMYDDNSWDYWWGVDDIVISGTVITSTYNWSSTSTGAGLPGNVTTPTITVTPTNGAGAYTYTVTSNNCGSATGTVNVVPAPNVVMSADAICEGQTGTINFVGGANNTVVFDDGTSNQTVILDGSGNGSYTTSALPVGSYTYNLVSVQNTTCTVSATGSTTLVVNPRPVASISGNPSICPGGLANIVVTFTNGTLPATIDYTDNTNNYNIVTGTNGNFVFAAPASTPGVYSYTLTGITDDNGCASLPGDLTGTATVTVNPNPSVTITAADPVICDGDNTDITLTFSGTAPYDFTYNNGMMDSTEVAYGSNTYMFNVSPVSATDYYALAITDGNGCIAQASDLLDSATVTMHETVAITGQPTDAPAACTGTGTSLTVTATGDGLTYQWYNGTTMLMNNPPYSGADMATLTISDVTGMDGNEYHVVVTDICGNSINSDTVSIAEDFDNHWSGAIDQDWNNTGNWSCGTIPTLTTNVFIPNTATNMPLININNAEANDINIDASASLMFTGSNNELHVAGNITSLGTFDATGGTVSLVGTGVQNIPAVTYTNLDVLGGSIKTLDGDATVTGILNLSNGFIQLGDYDLMLAMPWSQLGGSATSYIVTNDSGNVVGMGMGTGGNPDAVTFHVGTAVGSYNPITIENLGDVDTFTVRIMDSVYLDGYGVDPTTVPHPVINKTWLVSENTAGGSIINMTPFWNHPGDEINSFDTSHVYVAHYIGGQWIGYADSSMGAPAAMVVGNMLAAYADSITSLSPFTVASTGAFPLAIRLLDVTAANSGTRNKVDWKSATEAMGDSYTVETSVDGKSFTQLATVKANGKASSYTYWHETPVTGVNYYRIKMVDADEHISYSKVVSATVKATSIFAVEAYPNPVTSTVTIMVKGEVSGTGNVTVNDISGKVIKAAVKVENNKAVLNMSDVANGVYFINYTDDVNHESIKINKQ